MHHEGPANWTAELQKGDSVDVIRKEATLVGWTTGKVAEIKDEELIIALDAGDVRIAVAKDSAEVAPCGTYTVNEWRLKLSVGDIVDFLPLAGDWVQSTVVEVNLEDKPERVKLRTRIWERCDLDATAEETKEQERVLDDWVQIYSLRLQRKNSILNEDIEKYQRGIYEIDKEAVNDENDVLLNSPCHREVYCVQRFGKENTATVVGLVNILGTEGGLENMLSKIEKRTLGFGNVVGEGRVGLFVFGHSWRGVEEFAQEVCDQVYSSAAKSCYRLLPICSRYRNTQNTKGISRQNLKEFVHFTEESLPNKTKARGDGETFAFAGDDNAEVELPAEEDRRAEEFERDHKGREQVLLAHTHAQIPGRVAPTA